MISFVVRCPNYHAPGQHSAVRVRAKTIGSLVQFLALLEGCVHCGAIFNDFVAMEPDGTPACTATETKR